MVLEPETNTTSAAVACICHQGVVQPPITVVSHVERLTLEMRIDAAHASSSYFKHTGPLFEARYEFVHGPLCGPALLEAATDGELLFPHYEALGRNAEPPRTVHCIWELRVHKDRDLWLNLERVKFVTQSCDEGQLEISVAGKTTPFFSLCGEKVATASKDLPILTAAELMAGSTSPADSPTLKIVFRGNIFSAMPTFKIAWTELFRLPRNADGTLTTSRLTEAETGAEVCEFMCPGESGLCIPLSLVCNGVANCPLNNATASDDEGGDLCARAEAAPVNWLAVGLGAAGGGIMAAACLIVLCRACCHKRDSDDMHVPY